MENTPEVIIKKEKTPEYYDGQVDARYLFYRAKPDVVIVYSETGEEIIKVHQETISNYCLTLRQLLYCWSCLENYEHPKNDDGLIIIKTDYHPDVVKKFFEHVYKLPTKLPGSAFNNNALLELFQVAYYYDCYYITAEVIRILGKRFDDICEQSQTEDIPEIVTEMYLSLVNYTQEEKTIKTDLVKFLAKIILTYKRRWITNNQNSIYFFTQLDPSIITGLASDAKYDDTIIRQLFAYYIKEHLFDLKYDFFLDNSSFITRSHSKYRSAYLDQIGNKLEQDDTMSKEKVIGFFCSLYTSRSFLPDPSPTKKKRKRIVQMNQQERKPQTDLYLEEEHQDEDVSIKKEETISEESLIKFQSAVKDQLEKLKKMKRQ